MLLAGCRGVRAPDWNRARAINADGNYIKLFPIPPINKAFSIKVIEYLMRAPGAPTLRCENIEITPAASESVSYSLGEFQSMNFSCPDVKICIIAQDVSKIYFVILF